MPNIALGETEEYSKEKEHFKLFDFFANFEYFEEKFNYDEVIPLPRLSRLQLYPEGGDTGKTPTKEYENIDPDPVKHKFEISIGCEGMKIDRKFFEKFEETVKGDEFVKTKIYEGNYEEAEAYIKKEVFDRPEEYFNLEKLRRSVQMDRRLSLREILEKVFDKIKRFKTKDELLEEEVQKFISIYHPEPKFVYIIGQFMKAYILDQNIRHIIESKEFSELAVNPRFNMKDLKELDGWRNPVVDYVKDYVSLNTYL